MKKKLLLFLILTLLPFIAFAQNKVIGFRASDKDTYSRFVLDLKDSPKYKIFTLDSPARVVIDIDNTVWDDSLLPHSETDRIKSVRYSPKTSPLRIVLDLDTTSKISSDFILKPSGGNPYRLVVDIKPLDQSAENTLAPMPVEKNGDSLIAPKPTPKTHRKPIIVIDAGHGGHDPGTTGHKKTQEKSVTLAYAKELRDQLLETGHYKVYLTRSTDIYLKLRDRVDRARMMSGDLFISIHANSHENKSVDGLSVYTLSENASDKEAAALASKENKADLINGVNLEKESDDISEVLIEMTQRDTKNLSASFAEDIVSETTEVTKILRQPHRFAGFRVLTGVDIPAVLIELGYLTNKKEEKLLNSKNYRKKLTNSFVKAIDSHFSKYKIE